MSGDSARSQTDLCAGAVTQLLGASVLILYGHVARTLSAAVSEVWSRPGRDDEAPSSSSRSAPPVTTHRPVSVTRVSLSATVLNADARG